VHNVLKSIETILKNSDLQSTFGVKRIVTGTLKQAYKSLVSNIDIPAIIIVPGKQGNVASQIANCISVLFPIDFYIVSRVIRITEALQNDLVDNQEKTLPEIANEMMRLFASNKRLNGVVRMWSKKWDCTYLEPNDPNGNIVLKCSTEWKNDLVPFGSTINNQQAIPVDFPLDNIQQI
jgi:hypothetical protein